MAFRRLKDGAGAALGRPRRWHYLEMPPKRAIGAEIGVFGASSRQTSFAPRDPESSI